MCAESGLHSIIRFSQKTSKRFHPFAESRPPKVPIFVGGNHPTFLPGETLEEMRSVDIVVRGEGEWTTLELMTAACRMAKEAGLLVSGFWIVGHPGDDLEEFNHTYRAMKHLYQSEWLDGSSVFQYIPYPGTGPFQDPGRYDLEILSYDWSRYHLFRFDKPGCQLKAYAFSDIHASYRMLEATRRFAPQKAGIDNNISELIN